MNVEIHLLSASKTIKREDVRNTYTKGGMFCVYTKAKRVEKYPLVNIYCVTEDYK